MTARRLAARLVRRLHAGCFVLYAALPCVLARAADLEVVPLHSQASAAILHGKHIFVEVYSGRLEPYLRTGAMRPAHEAHSARLEWELLNPAVKVMALRRLFPEDRAVAGAFEHKVRYAGVDGRGEDLESIATWFTGRSDRVDALARSCGCGTAPLQSGTVIRIPHEMLSPELAELSPAPSLQAAVLQVPPPARSPAVLRIPSDTASFETPRPIVPQPPRSAAGGPRAQLKYGQDASGVYAEYRLQPGEILYSDVVVRFTGRVDVYDVGEAAELIARRSGIQDARELPAGTVIRIPIELLEPEYLPPTDPRHQEFQAQRTESDLARTRTSAQDLYGVVLVLDAGHGGNDPGTIGVCGLCEDEAAYDVMVRVSRLVETETRAKVLFTVQDRKTQAQPRDLWTFPRDRNEAVLTSPNYTGADAKVSANLRWYLANSLFRKLVKAGTPAEKIVFTSFHADARHPSAPGLMVYVPDAVRAGGTMLKTTRAYRDYAEVREQPRYTSTKQDRVRSEALSRDLAETLIGTMTRSGVGVHSDVPIRGYVNRRKKRYVPAVLRYNHIPVKLLVEIANLSSRRGCAALQDPGYREKVARAYVDGLLAYFGAQEVTARLVNGS